MREARRPRVLKAGKPGDGLVGIAAGFFSSRPSASIPQEHHQRPQGLTVKQVLFYFAILLLGMLAAFITETREAPRSTSLPAANAKTSLYSVLAPKDKSRKVVVMNPKSPKPLPLSSAATPKQSAKNTKGQNKGDNTTGHVKVTKAGSMAPINRTNPNRMWKGIRRVQRCDNSCTSANDGSCDDGSQQAEWPAAATDVKCDLGTDCADCSTPQPGQATASVASSVTEGSMIKDLLAEGTQVLVRSTNTVPSMKFGYTNPKHDLDVSGHVHNAGILEKDITYVWYKLLSERCQRSHDLVVDVGGNFGWYTIFAATMGCRVVTWEPVPRFRAFLLYNILLNNVGHLVEVRDTVVSNEGKPQTVIVPQRGIWGTAGIDGMNIDKAISNEGDYLHVISDSEKLDDVILEQAAVLKVDVEGFEPSVFASASRMLKEQRVDHIFLEYSPGVGHRAQNYKMTREFPAMLQSIALAEYNMRSFETPGIVTPAVKEDWSGGDYPELEMVTLANLHYDLIDMDNAIAGSAGGFACVYRPPEVVKKLREFSNCGAIPEGFHPMSFHSVFSHNTNVWATRRGIDQYPRGRVTGVMTPDEDQRAFFTTRDSPDGMRGMGGRVCKHLPAEVQLHHRCRCTEEAVCGQDEKLVLEAYAKTDRMPAESQQST